MTVLVDRSIVSLPHPDGRSVYVITPMAWEDSAIPMAQQLAGDKRVLGVDVHVGRDGVRLLIAEVMR